MEFGAVNLDQAREAGRWAREAGRGIETCPTYAIGQQGYEMRAAWRSGWAEEDGRIRALPALRKVEPARRGK